MGKPGPHESDVVTWIKVKDIREVLEGFVSSMRGLEDKMQTAGCGELECGNFKTGKKGLEFVAKFVSAAQLEFDRYLICREKGAVPTGKR